MPQIDIIYDNNWARARSEYPFLAADMDDILSYWVKGFQWMESYKRKKWDGKKHLYRAKDDTFPAGLVPYVKAHFEERDFRVNVDDRRVRPATTHELQDGVDTGPELRESQGEALDAAIRHTRGTFSAATGWGKTNLMSAIIKEDQVPALCLFHRNELAQGTMQRFRDTIKFPHAQDPFGFIGGGTWNPGLITCASFPTLVAMLASDKKGTMEWLAQFPALHVDECHHVPAKTLQHLLDATRGAFYRYGYSATPDKGEKSTRLELEAWIGPVIYEYGVNRAIQAGILTPPMIYMINPDYPDLPDHDREGHYIGTFNDEYKAGIAEYKPRNHLIAKHIEEAAKHGLPTLALVQHLEQGRQLQRFVEAEARFIHGSHTTDERRAALDDLAAGRLPVLIASSIFDEGVDVPAIGALSVAGGYKAEHKTLQRVGRGLRASPGKEKVLVFDYWDGHAEHLEAHSRSRLRTYRKNNLDVAVVTPAELEKRMTMKGFW